MKRNYDLAQLEKLADGDKDFIKEMVDLFIENGTINLAEMKVALDNEDYVSIGYLAHKIKPSLDLMGLTPLKTLIANIEKYSKEEASLDEIKRLIGDLDSFCKVVVNELKEDFTN